MVFQNFIEQEKSISFVPKNVELLLFLIFWFWGPQKLYVKAK